MSGDLLCFAAVNKGEYIELTVPGVTSAGVYSLIATVRKTRETGTVQAAVNGVSIWPEVNLYGYNPLFENVDFGIFTLDSDVTDLVIRFTVNELSSFYGDRGYMIIHSLILARGMVLDV